MGIHSSSCPRSAGLKKAEFTLGKPDKHFPGPRTTIPGNRFPQPDVHVAGEEEICEARLLYLPAALLYLKSE